MIGRRLREPLVLLLAAAAPVVLVTGVLLAQAAQRPGGYDPVRQTVSTLAGRGADERWVMTTGLLALGLVHLAVAAGLRAPRAGRWVLGAGALAVVVVALAPQPAHGSSAVHMTAMVLGCAAYTLWPLGLLRAPHLRTGSVVMTAVVTASVVWLCAQAWTGGTWLGVAERTVLLTQTVWPLRVALGTRALGTRARWTVVAATVPLLVFPVGLVAAQAAQPTADPLAMSLSALESLGAVDRWIMTTTVLTAGIAYVVVAAGLRRVPPAGRVLLGAGGACLAVAALFPQPVGGTSWPHMVAGGLAWVGFTTWPLSLVRSATTPPGLRRASSVAVGVMAALLAWFTVELVTGGAAYGLSQRVTVVVMGIWPLVLAVHGATRARTDPVPLDAPATALSAR
ncbi:DUF998 domain-containing protein [Actinomycetospora soli]|uniref:DUF998 domain-containing protein n=1 Tax=Actinomycetospora soli TaxID=2893887 RepID=UPI001E31384B|nr:DUF998 domain-containing protein [Actinomycetospora soli]MCD2190839.1 DUF998 domain-containing protein [Actinomycetospora soli]